MANIFNEQRVLGIRLVPDGTTMYLGRRVLGVRDATAAMFTSNLRTLGVAVLSMDQAIYNDQPVIGAVLISDGRAIYNGTLVCPVYAVSGSLGAGSTFAFGINEGFTQNQYSTDWARDLWDSSVWDSDMTTTGMGADGIPHSYRSGASNQYCYLNPFRSAARAGNYELLHNMPNATIAGGGSSIVTANSNGRMVFSLPSNPDGTTPASSDRPRLNFTGTIPPEGIKFTCRKVGDTNTNRYTDDATSVFTGLGGWQRNMTSRGINSSKCAADSPNGPTLRTAAMRWTGQNYNYRFTGQEIWVSNGMKVEAFIDSCNAANQNMWHNQAHIDDDDLVAAEAALVAANLAPGLKVAVELSNEVWNSGNGFNQYYEAQLFGVRRGYATAASKAAAVPMTVLYNGPGNSATTRIAVGTGQYFFLTITGQGAQVYQALADNPIGTVITPPASEGQNTADGKWKLVYQQAKCTLAGRRWYATRSKEVWAIWDAAFASASRPRPLHVIAWQAAFGFGAQAQEVLDWDNTYASTDRFAMAPYWGGGVGGATANVGPQDMGPYTTNNYSSPPYPHPWDKAVKDTALTDTAGFLNAFFAAAPDAINTTIELMVKAKADLATYVAAKGLAAGSIKLSSYECNWHVTWGTLGGWPTGMAAVHAQCWRDARQGPLLQQYLRAIRDQIGEGEHLIFDRVKQPSTNNGAAMVWGLQEYDTDTANPKLVAAKAVVAETA